jgi:hypothetical protein
VIFGRRRLPRRARIAAEQAVALAVRVRDTFEGWSRLAQARVLALALEHGILGRVDRFSVGLWIRWQGGFISRVALAQPKGQLRSWAADEDAALGTNYHRLTLAALQAMLPGRSADGIHNRARLLHLSRPHTGTFLSEPPVVIAAREIPNEMADYDFVAGASNGEMASMALACSSSGWSGRCSASARRRS